MIYHYHFVVATNAFRKELAATVDQFIDHPVISVIIVNGKQADVIGAEYNKAITNPACKVLTTTVVGKSNALNTYLRQPDLPNETFCIFTDDDVIFTKDNLNAYIQSVEEHGRGYYYGGSVSVIRKVEMDKDLLSLYPASIRGLKPDEFPKHKIFLGANWGSFANDIREAGYFSPYFGPGSITGSVGQESEMMTRLIRKGLKPCFITNNNVVHDAPDGFHTTEWLLSRKYREGIQKGLLSKRSVPSIAIRRIKLLLKERGLRRRIHWKYILGLLKSLRYSIPVR